MSPRPVFALTPADVALLGGVSPAPQDIDAANEAAAAMGFTLSWTRVVSVDGMTWQLTVDTPRGRFQCEADSEDSWHSVLKSVGLVE